MANVKGPEKPTVKKDSKKRKYTKKSSNVMGSVKPGVYLTRVSRAGQTITMSFTEIPE
jgi:hypothetical protein